jgi:transposase-like protein
MSIVSHLHQLFNAETCQSYIHTLRWKDRPLQCPRCQSHNVAPWGTYHYQPGLKRYRCKEKDCTDSPVFSGRPMARRHEQ